MAKRFTQEERLEDIQETKEMLLENLSYTEMSELLGRSRQYFCNLKDELLSSGELTKEELEEAKRKRQEEQRAVLDEQILALLQEGYNKSDIAKKLEITYSMVQWICKRLEKQYDFSQFKSKKEIEHEENLKIVKSLLQEGKSRQEIAKITTIPRTMVNRLVQELIDQGVIREEEIFNQKQAEKDAVKKRNEQIYQLFDQNVSDAEIARQFHLSIASISLIKKNRFQKPVYVPHPNKKDYNIKEEDDSLTSLEKEILSFLKIGYTYSFISKKIKMPQKELMEIVTSLKKRKYITQAIINDKKEERQAYLKSEILRLTKEGYLQADIYRTLNNDIEELSRGAISRIVTSLKEEGKVTEEGMKEVQDKQDKSYASIDQKVLEYFHQGMTVVDIYKNDPTGFLTESRVRRSKERLKKAGLITDKEVEKNYKKQRKRQKKTIEKQIWEYIEKEGLTDQEIASLMDFTAGYVGIVRDRIMKKKNLSTKDVNRIRKEVQEKKIQKQQAEEQDFLTSFALIKQKYQEEYEEKCYISEKTQKAYFELFHEKVKRGYTQTKQEIDFLCDVILYNPTYLTSENIGYVIEQYVLIKEEESASKLLNLYFSESKDKESLVAFKEKMMKLIEKGVKKKNYQKK